ncbi:MAG: hypothetical protein IT371_03935 [Deltaproteobacteria bacterium]|nr:hypothetical protein [Deltaproteobacteria bacterium]
MADRPTNESPSFAARLLQVAALALLGPTGCGVDERPEARAPHQAHGKADVAAAPSALCAIRLGSPGSTRASAATPSTWRSVEQDYLPQVLACENPYAGPEALRALAVAARSYLYYTAASLGRGGWICDSQDCQVYTCSAARLDPSLPVERQPPGHRKYFEAVRDTALQVLTYRGEVIAGFHMKGGTPGSGCRGRPDHWTEACVTYNEGLGDAQAHRAPSPFAHPASPNNHGCLSQLGSSCLEEAGYGYAQILGFYYGRSEPGALELTRAPGSCPGVTPASPAPTPATPVSPPTTCSGCWLEGVRAVDRQGTASGAHRPDGCAPTGNVRWGKAVAGSAGCYACDGWDWQGTSSERCVDLHGPYNACQDDPRFGTGCGPSTSCLWSCYGVNQPRCIHRTTFQPCA